PANDRDPSGRLTLLEVGVALVGLGLLATVVVIGERRLLSAADNHPLSDKQLTTVLGALDAAQYAAQEQAAGADINNYRRWFGVPVRPNWDATIQQGWNAIHAVTPYFPLSHQLEFSYNEGGYGRNSDEIAYVRSGEGLRIHLRSPFFNEILVPPERHNEDDVTQVDILIHEISHLVLDTDDITYGYHASLALAFLNPSLAIRNADNWGFASGR